MGIIKYFLLFLFIVASGAIFFYPEIFSSRFQIQFEEIKDELHEIDIKEIKKEIFTPPPLRSEKSAPKSILTEAGVIKWTNEARKEFGLVALTGNKLLDDTASLKIKDMLEKQYFAHVSPDGIGIETVAEINGYAYITIGENLALGDFENDKELVNGWMASPGHRANILNTRYQEIGVAVGKGIMEGRFTWLAVQVFGKPLSACPEPEENLKQTIDIGNSELTVLQMKLEKLREEIEKINPRKEREEYNRSVEEYNTLVAQYNGLVEQLKELVARFNAGVKDFNECAGN